jgi:ankyrin repeat protein
LTAIQLAIKERKLAVLAALLADPYDLVDPNAEAGDGDSPLVEACAQGDAEIVQMLVEAGADVHRASRGGLSPLLVAVGRGDVAILRLLLPTADLDRADRAGRTPLHLAAAKGFAPAVETLLPGSDPRRLDNAGYAPIHLAAKAGFRRVVEVFLEADTDLANFTDIRGRHLAHLAAAEGHEALLREVLESSALADGDDEGLSPLHLAARYGRIDAVRLLLEREIDPNSEDHFGWSPLHLACQYGHREVVRALLAKGADPRHLGRDPEQTPIDAAAAAGQSEIATLLASYWPDAKAPETTQRRRSAPRIDDSRPYRRSPSETALAPNHSAASDLRHSSGLGTGRVIRTLVDYPWERANDELYRFVLSQVGRVDDSYRISESSTRIEIASLPWYEGVRLIRLRDPSWSLPDLEIFFLIFDDHRLYRLNGTSPPIHEVNTKAPLRLSAQNVLDYLFYFCFFVRGQEGPFYLLDSLEDPRLQSLWENRERDPALSSAAVVVEACVRSPEFLGVDENGQFRASGVVFYSNAIFTADFAVQPSGMVEMLDDEPVATDLPFRIEAPIAKLKS